MQITKIGMRGHILELQSFPLNCILQPKQTPFKVLASLRNPLAQTESFARLIVRVHDLKSQGLRLMNSITAFMSTYFPLHCSIRFPCCSG